jgi:PAS domain S-box-containing protein
MAVLDAEGHILDCNEAAEQTLKLSRDEALGQSALVFRGPEDARKLELLLKRTVREGRNAEFETWVTRRDGGEIPVAMNVCPLSDAKGRVTAVGVALRDRSRQKALEQRLAEHEKMVTVGRLAGGMSHHINNILTAVSAQVELALSLHDADVTRQALRLTADSVERLSNITRNLLLYSGAEHPPATTCRPEVVARRVLRHLDGELSGGNVRLVSRIDPTPAVQLDARDFQQVLDNLLNNAREAVAGSGDITVTVTADRHGEVVVTVDDSGAGIRPEDLPHVFEPFWTTRGSLAGGTDGSLGLGLTVARSLAASAGGSVDIVSAADRGATVIVRLPAAPADDQGSAR